MPKHLSNILKLLLIILIGIIIYFAGILIINTVYDYRPEGGVFELEAFKYYDPVEEQDTLSVITWNIGYAGLGKDADFFYDGGKMSKPAEIDYKHYLNGILEKIQLFDSVDFLLFQEVDISSSRSYGKNQQVLISEKLGSHSGLFTKNYGVAYVPMPIFDPMASVESGLSFFSKRSVHESYWQPFEGNHSWPLGLFMPDRCYSVHVIEVTKGKRLYIINTHNSAFDDGSLRNKQLEHLYYLMDTAYQNGHYVVAGGDWNLNPDGYTADSFLSGDVAVRISNHQIVSGPNKSWQVIFDPDYPSNRDVSAFYTPAHTPTSILDFFVCSPNIRLLDIKTIYNNFKYSDHQPVYLRFKLD